MASIPRLSHRKYNQPEYRQLYTQAYEASKIFMIILDRRTYSKIEYDLATVRSGITLSEESNHRIIKMYDDYVKASRMSPKHYEYAGGSRNLIMTVLRKDALLYADKLYKYIEDNSIEVKQ